MGITTESSVKVIKKLDRVVTEFDYASLYVTFGGVTTRYNVDIINKAVNNTPIVDSNGDPVLDAEGNPIYTLTPGSLVVNSISLPEVGDYVLEFKSESTSDLDSNGVKITPIGGRYKISKVEQVTEVEF